MTDRPARRVAGFGTTIFTEMSALAIQYSAVNLGQGFPDFAGPEFIKQAAAAAIAADLNQYAPSRRRAVAARLRARGRLAERGERHQRRDRGALRCGAGVLESWRQSDRLRAGLRRVCARYYNGRRDADSGSTSTTDHRPPTTGQ